jgi:hypothetical protein
MEYGFDGSTRINPKKISENPPIPSHPCSINSSTTASTEQLGKLSHSNLLFDPTTNSSRAT